jgi:hypothetical protein
MNRVGKSLNCISIDVTAGMSATTGASIDLQNAKRIMKLNLSVLKILLVCIAICLSNQSKSQSKKANYLEYYNLINSAAVQLYEKDTSGAIDTYVLAFKNFAGFEVDYYVPIRLTLVQKKYKLTYWFIEQKVLNTGWFAPDELFGKKLYDGFINSKYGKKYLHEFPKWIVENDKKYILNNLSLFLSIDASDQLLRDATLRPLKKYMLNDSVYREARSNLIEHVDSLNFIRFKNYCKNYGFPGRSTLGGNVGYSSTFLTHVFKFADTSNVSATTFEKERFLFLDSTLKKQVLLGEYEPSSFAYCIDYSLGPDSVALYGLPRYWYGKEFINYPLLDPENVNNRRAAIGLMPIEIERKINNLPLPPNYVAK